MRELLGYKANNFHLEPTEISTTFQPPIRQNMNSEINQKTISNSRKNTREKTTSSVKAKKNTQ